MNNACKLEQMLPASLRRRGTAALLTAVMALVGVLGIGGAKLKAYESRTAQGFSTGMYSITADLDARLNSAANLISVAGMVQGVAPASLESAQAAIQLVQNAQGPAAKAAADKQLAEVLKSLYAEADALADANQANLLAGQLAEFSSRGNIIANNDYNFDALAFNDDLGEFPANVIGAVWGIRQAEYYQ